MSKKGQWVTTHDGYTEPRWVPAQENLKPVDQRRLVLPRQQTQKWHILGNHLDTIHHGSDDAIHKGYCKRNARKLDAALTNIITAAEASRAILRQNDERTHGARKEKL